MEAAAARAEIADLTADKPRAREVVERLLANLPAVGRMGRLSRWRWWARAAADLAAALWADVAAQAVAADAYVQSCCDILERGEARAIVRALADANPVATADDRGAGIVWCQLCLGSINDPDDHADDHDEDCPWARAREWVAAHGGPEVK